MADALLLSVGDGATADHLNLLDGTKHKLSGDITWPTPGEEDRFRVVTLPLYITGTTTDNMIANVRNIEKKLSQAKQASGPHGRGQRVTLGVQMNNATEMVYFDINRGTLQWGKFRAHQLQVFATMTLECEPFVRGDPVTTTVSGTITNTDGTPATPGNSGSGSIYLADIPGDVPAPTQFKLIDVSTNSKIINRFRIGIRSFQSMTSTDHNSIIDQVSNSPGADTTTNTNRIGANYSQITTSIDWQDICDFSGGTPAEYNRGIFDVWIRTLHNQNIKTPINFDADAGNAGSLASDTYLCCVTALDASSNETAASNTSSCFVGVFTDEVDGDWDHGGSTPTNHRFYWKRGTNAWQYKATGSTASAYSLQTETGGTTADPPGTSSIPQPQVRALVSMASAQVTFISPAVEAASDGTNWNLTYLGRFELPPWMLGEGLSDQPWKITIQGKSASANTPILAVDGMWIFPADESQAVIEYPGLTLATQREWIIDSRRDKRSSCILRSKADQTEQGQANVVGWLGLAPGDNLITFHTDVAAGVSDVIDAKFTAQITYYPRYRYLTGVA